MKRCGVSLGLVSVLRSQTGWRLQNFMNVPNTHWVMCFEMWFVWHMNYMKTRKLFKTPSALFRYDHLLSSVFYSPSQRQEHVPWGRRRCALPRPIPVISMFAE